MRKENLAKLKLNDSSFVYEPENSAALGLGFRCGFLGLLHLEIIVQRLDREYNLNLITTTPGVVYKISKHDGTVMDLHNNSKKKIIFNKENIQNLEKKLKDNCTDLMIV